MLYGLKDCANMTVKSKKDGKIKLYVDYAKTSTIEFTSDSVYANRKNVKAVRWDKNREGTFTTTMEIFNMDVIAMLFGADIIAGKVPFMKREVCQVKGGKATLTTSDTIKTGTLAIYKLDTSDMKSNLDEQKVGTPATSENTYSIDGKTITLNTTTFTDNDGYVACYYMVETDAKSFTVDDVSFPGGYEIYGDTNLRNTEQNDEFVQFHLTNVKPQSNVTLTMDVDNVCSLEITWDILSDKNGDMMTWSKVA